MTFANVHLSHGQLLNRWQLLDIANRRPLLVIIMPSGQSNFPVSRTSGRVNPPTAPTISFPSVSIVAWHGVCAARARAMSDAPNRIRVRQTFLETLDVKFPKGKRGMVQRRRPSRFGIFRQLSKEEAKAP